MQIIPAIDIRNGKCVRLTQGDFSQEKIYSDDPVTIAKQWENDGATMLHVVDLDGAKNGELTNLETIKSIINEINIPIQVGGGIRNKKAVEQLLTIGVARVILGTVALEDKKELKNILSFFPTQVAIALDGKNGKLMQRGWLEESKSEIIETIQELEKMGVQSFIFTDVVRDGSLTEPNYREIKKIKKSISVLLIVGGGISTIDQVKKLKLLGVEGVILGKALYEKRINLKEAIHVS